MPKVLQDTLWTPRPHPETRNRKTAPEDDACRKAEPEHDSAEQHVENLEREEDDE